MKKNETDQEIKNMEFLCEPKLDGLAIELIYEKGKLTQAITRGDGQVGEGVLANIKTIPNVPLQLNPQQAPPHLSLRGEIVMHEKDFLELNEKQKKQGESLFANARNATAGSVRQLDSKITAQRKLHFYAHSHSFSFLEGKNGIFPVPPAITNQKDFLNYLKDLYLPLSNFIAEKETSPKAFENWRKAMEKILETKGWSPQLPLLYLCSDLEEMMAYKSFIQKWQRKFPFAIDGIVAKINDFSLQEKMGHIARSPRWAMAAKFPEEEAQAKITKIELQVGRTGVITPVAHLEPVSLSGVIIRRASLHNQEEIRRKNIHEQDLVSVKRAGDVIPQVVSVIEKAKGVSDGYGESYFVFPEKCPSCQHAIHLIEEKKESKEQQKQPEQIEQPEKKTEKSSFYTSSIQYRCINPLCPAMVKQSLRHFISRPAMNIDHLGPKLIAALYEKGFVQKFSDLYQLNEEKISSLWKKGDKAVQNLLKSIEESKKVPFQNFIYALGIPFVGQEGAKVLAEHFRDLSHLLSAKKEELEILEGIGAKTASCLEAFLKNLSSEVKALTSEGRVEIQYSTPSSLGRATTTTASTPTVTASPVQGKRFVLTGTLPLPRSQIKKLLEEQGAKVGSALSTKTHYLLVGDSPGSKLKKAQELSITIIDWDQLQKWKILS